MDKKNNEIDTIIKKIYNFSSNSSRPVKSNVSELTQELKVFYLSKSHAERANLIEDLKTSICSLEKNSKVPQEKKLKILLHIIIKCFNKDFNKKLFLLHTTKTKS